MIHTAQKIGFASTKLHAFSLSLSDTFVYFQENKINLRPSLCLIFPLTVFNLHSSDLALQIWSQIIPQDNPTVTILVGFQIAASFCISCARGRDCTKSWFKNSFIFWYLVRFGDFHHALKTQMSAKTSWFIKNCWSFLPREWGLAPNSYDVPFVHIIVSLSCKREHHLIPFAFPLYVILYFDFQMFHKSFFCIYNSPAMKSH